MIDDPDEELRKARRLAPAKSRRGVQWRTIADSRKAQHEAQVRQQPPVLAGIARQIGADK
jgi:hypothetical protein